MLSTAMVHQIGVHSITEQLKFAFCEDDGAESCTTTTTSNGQEDNSSQSSSREDDSQEDIEQGNVTICSWKTASFSDDDDCRMAWPLRDDSHAAKLQMQEIPMMCAAWVPIALPFTVVCNDLQKTDAEQLVARAEDLKREAANLRAAAKQVRTSAVGAEVVEQNCDGAHPPALASTGASAARTTVMLRNIPNKYNRATLLELLDKEGFAACYDFFYLPMDLKRNTNLGYLFLNLVTAEEANRFHDYFNGFCGWNSVSQKVGEVGWGEPLQGLKAQIKRYRNSPVMHQDLPDEHKPLLFAQGKCIPFPGPTKNLRARRDKVTLDMGARHH